ncbi:MAG TPA: hypothetical protein VJL31_10345 [Gemmatimonadales bacterium]|nr:hypothetical protein [Gemmatimonadales bacterium]
MTMLATGACRDPIPTKYALFFELPRDVYADSLLTYSVKDRVEIYLIAMTHLGPPPDHLARVVAQAGLSAVPYIMMELDSTSDDHAQSALAYVLEEMACQGHPVGDSTAAAQHLETLVGQMPEGYWRARVSESLEVIRGQRGCTVSEEELRQGIRQIPHR